MLRHAAALACLTLLFAAGPVARARADDSEPIGWPLELVEKKGTVIIYQPQPESFANDRLEARAAVSVRVESMDAPVFGAVWFDARVATDFDDRLVRCTSVQVTAAKFPDAKDEHVEKLSRYLERELPTWDLTISLDRLLASLDLATGGEAGFNDAPPQIIVRNGPAVLVMIDGDPQLAELEGSDLQHVVNTPFFVMYDGKTYYLKGGAFWYAARDLQGPWNVALDLPKSVAEVAKQVDAETAKHEEEARAAAGDEAPEELDPDEPEPAEIVVRTEPAELVVIDGEPDFASVQGTQLLYLRNSEGDVILDIADQSYYLLLAGRWYSSRSLTEGPWAHVAQDALPAEFASIPAGSDMANVRVSVASTDEAREAALEASIPRTAEVDRKTASVEVTYDGDPEFEKCTDDVAYAINTDKDVLLVEGTYYCCDEAIWFVSRRPDGPWEVATSVPPEIQDIPSDCPVYNVRYVNIYEHTEEVVYVGYTSGYTSSYVYGGCVVYGTGWSYQPWYGHRYYPRPVTYGFGVHYNPWTGWGFTFGVSVGWLHVSFGRPYYGGWWGRGGYRYGYRHGYHHGYRHGYARGARAGYRVGQVAGGNNLYRSRSSGVRSTGASRPPAPAATPSRQPQKSNRPNDVYADRNGNVHRKSDSGWQTRDNRSDSWSSSGQRSSPSTRPSTSPSTHQSLDRQVQSRQRGAQRTQSYQTQHRSRSGAHRGGGGRRR